MDNSINEEELRAAIADAEARFGCRLSFTLARKAVLTVSEKYQRCSFPDALRYGLNELDCPPNRRKEYGRVVGMMLGRRGNVRSRLAKSIKDSRQ